MADPSQSAEADQRRLVFQVGEQRHEIDASLVMEVIRSPHITRVPNGPQSLQGIANLRGRPLPVLSMGSILNGSDTSSRHGGKIIVYEHGGAVGLLVDDVLRLSVSASASPIQGFGNLLDAAFNVSKRKPVERTSHVDRDTGVEAAGKLTALLSFRVTGQLYGLPLASIREVGALGGEISRVANSEEAIVGLVQMRDALFPVVSLASLLGLDAKAPVNAGSRIVVVEFDGQLVGLVVDELDAIQRLPDHAMDAVPDILQKGRGSAEIEAIGRIADGRLLISILSPERLFGHRAVSIAIEQNMGVQAVETTSKQAAMFEQFLIFQLGDESYGMPIAAVDEVIRVPGEVTRMPGAPSFVMGVVNLRGKAVPLIDQRARFAAALSTQTAKARAIIVTIGGLQAGVVVDSVSEVKAVPVDALSAAPEFSTDRTDVFDRIAPIDSDGRMILLIDPKELLTRAERDLMTTIAENNMVADKS